MKRPVELLGTEIRFSAPGGATHMDCERIALYLMYTLGYSEVEYVHNERVFKVKLNTEECSK